MAKPAAASPRTRDIVAQASSWFVRLQAGADERTVREWETWRLADPEHAAVWQRFAALHDLLPDGSRPRDKAQAAAIEAVAGTLGRRTHLKLILSTLTVGLAASGGYRYASGSGWLADYQTQVGEQRSFDIGAGHASLLLNTDTAVDIKENGRFTDVHLYAGELLLNDTGRTSAADIRVVTRDAIIEPRNANLLVRCLRADAVPHTFAALGTGSARITTPAQVRQDMHAGQMLRIAGGRIIPQDGRPDREFAWTQGVLVADDMRLADFLEQLGRYRPGFLRCAPGLENLRVTGTFRIQNTDRVLQVLAESLRLRLEYRTRYWVTVVPA